jgi:hypothetical protein
LEKGDLGGFAVFLVKPAATKTNQEKSYIVSESGFFPFADDRTNKIIKLVFKVIRGFPVNVVSLASGK